MADELDPRGAVSIIQPYFLPYLGWFALARASETLVILDSVQFKARRFMSRNRFRAPGSGEPVMITVPLHHAPLGTKIQDVRVSYEQPWLKKFRKGLELAYARAPYFKA